MSEFRQSESGNVFWYIFLCIALLGALSFAVARGGRTTVTSLSSDRTRLDATEIIAYGDTIAKAVNQLRLRGTAETALSFANEFLSSGYGTFGANPDNEIFSPAGGAVVYHAPPGDATQSAQDYRFLANNEIELIGTTGGGAANVDLVMAVTDLKQGVCEEINNLVDVTNPGGIPPTDTDIDETTFYVPGATPFGSSPNTVGDEDSALSGQREACFYENGTQYVYYKVLISR